MLYVHALYEPTALVSGILATKFALYYMHLFCCCLGRSEERSVRGDRDRDGAHNSPYGGMCRWCLVSFCHNRKCNRYILLIVNVQVNMGHITNVLLEYLVLY